VLNPTTTIVAICSNDDICLVPREYINVIVYQTVIFSEIKKRSNLDIVKLNPLEPKQFSPEFFHKIFEQVCFRSTLINLMGFSKNLCSGELKSDKKP
jgi:hypothetical protein